jgi:hypothetical protein
VKYHGENPLEKLLYTLKMKGKRGKQVLLGAGY